MDRKPPNGARKAKAAERPKVLLPLTERNSFFIEELMARNGWSRAFTYRLISRGILRTYKDGKRRRASAEAEREAIARLEHATTEGVTA